MKNKKKSMTNHAIYWALITLIAVAVSAITVSVNSAQAAWTNPPYNPPGSNLGAPLNTSNTLQRKGGALWLNVNHGFPVGLIVNYGIVDRGILTVAEGVHANYTMDIGTVYSRSDYRRVDNRRGPWIYAFGSSPDAPSFAGSVGIRVDGSRGRDASLIVGRGKGRFTNVWAAGFRRASDKRLKKDIKTVKNALTRLINIRGVEYKLKDNDKPGIGVIAQEIEKSFPTLVSQGPNGYKMVDYDGFSGVFIEAIKEQQKAIESQQKQIDDQQRQINELKTIIKNLKNN